MTLTPSLTTARLPILGALVVLMASIVTFTPQNEVAAQAGWGCNPGFYQVLHGQMAELDPPTGLYNHVGPDHANFNAMGHNPADGYLYGMRERDLVRVGNDGVATVIADLRNEVEDIGPYTGDFGDDGLLYIASGSDNWYTIDVSTFQVTRRPGLDFFGSPVGDAANVNGKFYGIATSNHLIVFDPATDTSQDLGLIAGLPASNKFYGAAWSTAGGNLYVNRNSGQIYQITGYSGTSPVATELGRTSKSNANDGASCRYAPPPTGVADVDGAAPETPASTPEGQAAEAQYIQDVQNGVIAIDIDENPEIGSQEAPAPEDPPGDNYAAPDAGLGTGASCSPNIDEDRLPRAAVNALDVTETAVVYSGTFDTPDTANWLIQSGSWAFNNGAYEQVNTCGFDYTSLLVAQAYVNYEFEATFRGLEGSNHGGIVIGQASEESRSGAWLIDLADGGSVLRWGQYDNAGYYGTDGVTLPVAVPAAGESVTIRARVLDGRIEVFFNGASMGFIEAEATGHVGLVASTTAVAFDEVTLTAIPSETN